MKSEDIQNVAVIGAGLMGHGIAQEFAMAGYKVTRARLLQLNSNAIRGSPHSPTALVYVSMTIFR